MAYTNTLYNTRIPSIYSGIVYNSDNDDILKFNGSGYFSGHYVKIANYSGNIDPNQFSIFLTYDKIITGNSILLSSYNETDVDCSGFTIGINDANRYFIETPTGFCFTFNKIIPANKNCLCVVKGNNSFSINLIDLKSREIVETQQIGVNANSKYNSDSFFIGGNPAFETGRNFDYRFIGFIDSFAYIDKAITRKQIEALSSGLLPYVSGVSGDFFTERSNYYYVGLSGTGITSGRMHPVSLATDLYRPIFSGLTGDVFSGLFSGTFNNYALTTSGNIYKTDPYFNISGSPTFYSRTGVTTLSGSGSFVYEGLYSRQYYSGGAIPDYSIWANKFNYSFSGIQPSSFLAYRTIEQKWTPSGEYIEVLSTDPYYSGYMMSGIAMSSNVLNSSGLILQGRDFSYPYKPADLNKQTSYNVFKQQRLVSDNSTGVNLIFNRIEYPAISVTGKVIGSGTNSSGTGFYDIQISLDNSTSIFSGNSFFNFVSGRFFKKASVAYKSGVSLERLYLGRDYIETSTVDMIHAKSGYFNPIPSGIYENDFNYWI